MAGPLDAIRSYLMANGRPAIANGSKVLRGKNGDLISVGAEVPAGASVFEDLGVPLVEHKGEIGGGSVSGVIDFLKSKGFAVPAAAAGAASVVPTDAQAKLSIPSLPWRPIADVAKELGVKEVAPHTYDFARFMNDMRGKIASDGLSDRDLMKAYGITASSIGRTGRRADAVRRGGLPDIVGDESVRPEGAFGMWLMTPHGQAFLNDAERGVVNEESLANLTKLFGKGEDGGAGFGKQNQLADQLRLAVSTLPEHKDAIQSALLQTGHEPLREAMMALPGINASKAGFISSLLGNGAMPTLDARQIILHTGGSTDNAAKVLGRKGAAARAVDELATRQEELGLQIPSEFLPNYQHLAHHTIWDKTSGTQTTHHDLIDAMKKAGIAGLVSSGGAYGLLHSTPAEAGVHTSSYSDPSSIKPYQSEDNGGINAMDLAGVIGGPVWQGLIQSITPSPANGALSPYENKMLEYMTPQQKDILGMYLEQPQSVRDDAAAAIVGNGSLPLIRGLPTY